MSSDNNKCESQKYTWCQLHLSHQLHYISLRTKRIRVLYDAYSDKVQHFFQSLYSLQPQYHPRGGCAWPSIETHLCTKRVALSYGACINEYSSVKKPTLWSHGRKLWRSVTVNIPTMRIKASRLRTKNWSSIVKCWNDEAPDPSLCHPLGGTKRDCCWNEKADIPPYCSCVAWTSGGRAY